ncbi:hypothetical protein ROS1_56930 [Roseibium sp. ROS1]
MGAIAILDVSNIADSTNEKATGVGDDVTLAFLESFARIISENPPPLSVSLINWP